VAIGGASGNLFPQPPGAKPPISGVHLNILAAVIALYYILPGEFRALIAD
jgi:hypothetical protein